MSNKYFLGHTFAWRRDISWSDLEAVQSSCENVMDMLGYQTVLTKLDLIDNQYDLLKKTKEEIWHVEN